MDARPSFAPPVIRLADYRPPDWRVERVELTLALDAERTEVTARLHVARDGAAAADGTVPPLVLDAEDMELLALRVDGVARDERVEGGALRLALRGDAAVVEARVAVRPAANTRLMGLYASSGLLVTQCEAEGFRRIAPYPDRPDVLATWRVRLEADAAKYPVLLSNGNPVGAGDLPGGRHWAEWDDPHPKPAYLFAAVAGDLAANRDRFTTMSGREVALNIWVKAADLPRTAHAMAALKASFAWDEREYGREYDLDVFNLVAVDDFNAGAMENKGLNIFNAKYVLADAETATDWDFDSVAGIVAHEYFHNWSGNRVTCRDWFQLSLKEGFTVFRDQQFMADQGSPAVKRIEEVRGLRAAQFPEDQGPLKHAVRPDSYAEIGNFYTATVYSKGAELIRMLHTLAGPAAYRRATDAYFAANDGRAATVEDWLACFAAEGVDTEAFRRWYETPGTPKVTARLRRDGDDAVLSLAQSHPFNPGAPLLPLPLRVALFDRQSGARVADERLALLTGEAMEVRFEGVRAPALPSVNRGFSAPVLVDAGRDDRPLSRDELAMLAACDDDPVNRWDAMQRLMLSALTDSAGAGAAVGHAEVIAAVRATLDGADADPAFVGEAALLPTEALIGDAMAVVDPEAIHAAREGLRRALGAALEDRWWALFHDLADGDAALTPRAKGRRRLRGVAIGYLLAGGGHDATAAAFLMFDDARTMTERMAALTALANSNAVEREEALQRFEARFRDDPNVMDKWFAVQAGSSRPDALGTVKRLMARPDYSAANPNRLRSVVLTFANNQLRFHAEDGEGYAFVADQVLHVDGINPGSAARLAAPLTRWRRFGAARQALMRGQLERIAAAPNLSRDVAEIVASSLKDR